MIVTQYNSKKIALSGLIMLIGASSFLSRSVKAQNFPPNRFDTISVELPVGIDGSRAGTSEGDSLNFALSASDGLFYEFIKLSWTEPRAGLYYRVLRGTVPRVSEMQEISRGWKRSNWLVDKQGLKHGITYYYLIEATEGSDLPVMRCTIDSGFLKPDDVFADPPTKTYEPPH